MQDFLNSFKNLIKSDDTRTDSNVFKLHYKFTVILLVVFSILLSSKQYFGDPISCDVKEKKEIVDVFCWVSGTFILPGSVSSATLEAYKLEGIGNPVGKEIYTLFYYQWVCLLFCIQALMFYIPRYLWKSWEGNRLGIIVKDLKGPLTPEHWSAEYKEKIADFMFCTKDHNAYALTYAFCELLSLGNLILQVLFMDWYLGGKFSKYGYEVATKPWPQPHNTVFPKRTTCLYAVYGPSGGFTVIDALCVLPLNVLNEKFFLILWYWIIFLFPVTVGALVYRAVVLTTKQFRATLLKAQIRHLPAMDANAIANHLSFGQFFILYNIGKNLNPIVFYELLLCIAARCKNRGNL